MKSIAWTVLGAALGAAVGIVAVQTLLSPGRPSTSLVQPTDPGMTALFAGDYEGALKAFEAGERSRNGTLPGDQRLFWKAYVLHSLGRHGEAIETYDRVVDEFPRSPRAAEASYEAAGIVERDLRNLQEAKTRYESIQKRFPEIGHKAYARLARVDELNRDFRNAALNYGNCVEQATQQGMPTNSWTAQSSYNRQQFITQNEDFEGKPLALYMGAEEDVEQGRFEEAEEKLKKIILGYPESSLADDARKMLQEKFPESRAAETK